MPLYAHRLKGTRGDSGESSVLKQPHLRDSCRFYLDGFQPYLELERGGHLLIGNRVCPSTNSYTLFVNTTNIRQHWISSKSEVLPKRIKSMLMKQNIPFSMSFNAAGRLCVDQKYGMTRINSRINSNPSEEKLLAFRES